MKNCKKILAFLLLATVLFSLGGCGKNPKPGENSNTKSAYDFKGETITIVDLYEVMGGEDERTVERIKKVDEDFNVKIEIAAPKGNYGSAMISSIASGKPVGHILACRDTNIADWYSAGVFANLNVAMNKTGIDFTDSKIFSQVVRKYTNINGEQLCFGKESPVFLSGVWMFNKRIFKEMGLDNPYELYTKGEWTWDKVEELAVKATVRKGDGTVTQWGLASYMATPFAMEMVLCNGGSIAGFTEDGKPSINLQDPKTIEAIERLRDWAVVKKILRTNDGSEVWDTVYKEFPNGNIAIFAGLPISYAVEANMKDEYGIIGCPKGSSAKEYINPITGFSGFFIPKTYEAQSDRLINLMEALWKPDSDASAKELITQEYASTVYDKESLDNLISFYENPRPTAFDAFQVFSLEWTSPSLSDMFSVIINGNKSVGDTVSEFNDMLKTNAEEIWDGLTLTGK